MTKKTFLSIISVSVIIYLLIGVVFYTSTAHHSQSVIHLCPEGAITEEQMQDCPPQTISLKTDWPSAVTVTVGWLPLLILQAINR